MKAIVYESYGSPGNLRCEEIDKPAPGDNEVLIRVCAASVNPLDWKLMKGGPLILRTLVGLFQPKLKRPGVDAAGWVEAVGSKVTQFKTGDAVFGTCRGAFAEYTICKSALVLKPDNVTFEEAASAPV